MSCTDNFGTDVNCAGSTVIVGGTCVGGMNGGPGLDGVCVAPTRTTTDPAPAMSTTGLLVTLASLVVLGTLMLTRRGMRKPPS